MARKRYSEQFKRDAVRLITDQTFIDQRDARAELFDYIEVFYNRQRIHSAIGYLSPAAYEQKHQAA